MKIHGDDFSSLIKYELRPLLYASIHTHFTLSKLNTTIIIFPARFSAAVVVLVVVVVAAAVQCSVNIFCVLFFSVFILICTREHLWFFFFSFFFLLKDVYLFDGAGFCFVWNHTLKTDWKFLTVSTYIHAYYI